MANNTYVLDSLVTGTQTITVTDDGTGSDWLVVNGVYTTQTDLRLSWSTDGFGNSTSGMGLYFNPDHVGHRLVIEGLIENIRGSNGLDFIQGNEVANILYGDNTATGPGDADSLYGYDGNDTIYGGAGNDDIGGGNDNDRLFGNAGVDTISGGGGIDTIEGGTGADIMAGGGDLGDMVSYAGSSAGVRVNITHGTATTGVGGDAQGDQITGFTHVTGSAFDDILVDTVKGTIAFGYNDNGFNGGAGNDRIFAGGGNDTLNGGDGNDILLGESGNDVIVGGAGNDTIRGGNGADWCAGGAGADTFQFVTFAESTPVTTTRDMISDFSAAQGDVIDLSMIDAITTTPGTNDAFHFIGTAAFTQGDAGQLRVQQIGATWVVTADLNGDRVSDFAIYVISPTALVEGDFIL